MNPRFRAAEEFRKLGGQVDICGQDCTVHGTESLAGAVVESHELRGGAALLLAGIFAGEQPPSWMRDILPGDTSSRSGCCLPWART